MYDSENTNPMPSQKTTFKQTEIGMIPEEWEMKSISKTCVISLGGTPKTEVKEFWNGKVKWASARDVANCKSRYITNTERTITEKGVDNSNAKIHPKDTIIITSRGTVGAIALLPEPMTFNQTCYGLQPKKEYNSMYIYYALKNSIGKLKSVSYGTVFETITTKTFNEVKIPLPPLLEQSAIAKILCDLDARIELNQQMNKTLEAIGQALFKHWFVDFEFPCLPKSYDFGAGKPADFDSICTYKAVGGLPVPDGKKWFVYVLLCKNESFYIGITNDLYRRWYEHKKGIGAKWTKANEPIKVIHYEEYNSQAEAAKREKELKTGFGRKWLKREYNKYLKLKQGLPACNAQAGLPACNAQAGLPAPECKLRQAGRMVYNEELGKEIPEGWRVGRLKDISENFDSKRIPLSSREREKRKGIYPYYGATGILDFIDDYIFDGIYLLMGEDGSVVDDKGFPILQYVFGKFWVNNHAHVLKGKRISTEMLYLLLKNTNVSHIVTGAVQPKINQENMNKLKFAIPQEDDLIEKLKMVISIIFDRISQNQQQSLTLSRIRDALLPKLMSGKIRVPVDEIVNGENP